MAEFDRPLDKWNARFSEPGYRFGREPNAFLAGEAHRLRAGETALCVADGEGRNSVFLARQGLRVTAFDLSPVGVAKARALAALHGVDVDYRVADILDWDWHAARYDVVVAIFIQFLSPAQRATVFAGMRDAVAPGGRMLVEGYRPEQLANATGGPREDENLYTEAWLARTFEGWTIERLESRDTVLAEGTAHVGPSAVVDLVARKPPA